MSPYSSPPDDSLRLLVGSLPTTTKRARRQPWPVPALAPPPLLRPLLRAYLLGYASSVGPRLLTLILRHLTSWSPWNSSLKPQRSFWESLNQVLCFGLEWQRFPTFCAALVGVSTLLEAFVRRALQRSTVRLSGLAQLRLARWTSTFVAAWLSLSILQSKQTASFTDTIVAKSDKPPGVQYTAVRYAGRTLDLTLFAATRALDVIVGELWSRRRARRVAHRRWTRVEALVSTLTDPAMFAASCALIMWTWIYVPARLPRAYNGWISSAAAVDPRLIEALRRVRTGRVRYGEDTGQAALLQGMCTDFKWPLEWGDPAKAVPFPCEMVHMGSGPSCEYHAINRFHRSWYWALMMYLPLNLLLVTRNPSHKSLLRAFISASRSSAFLGTFITLFYYGVCLARTRLGPRILGKDAAARQAIDGGLCVASGCMLCGWSIMIENPSRRKDMALFVAPRALATLLPRRYPLDLQWRETMIFALSTAVVFTCARENKARVRGVIGGLLGYVLEV